MATAAAISCSSWAPRAPTRLTSMTPLPAPARSRSARCWWSVTARPSLTWKWMPWPAATGTPNPLLDGVQDFTVSVNDGPDMLFINTPNLFIDALSGNDDIVVREPAPNQAVWNVQVYVAGGAPASDANRLGDNIELE